MSIPTETPAEISAFNGWVERETRDLPKLWDVGPELARKARDEGKSIFGPLVISDRASVFSIAAGDRKIGLRVIPPKGSVRGVFMHVHGGGWVLGAADHHDPMLERLADATGLTVVSVDYRLAPEHPYPAAPDDCEAAALWLVDNAEERFGVPVVAIGGESAGAHLAAVTMLRLRDNHDVHPFRAALLTYGMYDLRGTPSARTFGDRPLILPTPVIEWFVDQFTGGDDLEHPDVSPLMAALHDMPPALFTVGDLDPLIDDSLFMAARWAAAGSECALEVWPHAIHAWDYFETGYGLAARDRMAEFLNDRLA
ncbi:MAG: alpha/beta hydrolase fold domain-containing protein [Acidimicrobiia bacterium]|nr:alpha/beta hydrolase fold domain-containing protein [Acidimicrobiia bacterium]MDH5292732.1 alpha/beta hydrolase fold domain-containing protein [Acidimicrobiia bacterium]